MPDSFERLDMLWEKYPQFRQKQPRPCLDNLLAEHESWQEEFTDDLRLAYEEDHDDEFLVPLSRNDLSFRMETRRLIEQAPQMPDNPFVSSFLEQFSLVDTSRKAAFLFPESESSHFLVLMEVCKRAEILMPVRNLFPDEERRQVLAVFDKRNMDDVLLMFHLVYGEMSDGMPGGYLLYDDPLVWYQTHLRERGVVLRSPYLPDRLARYQGNLPFCMNPVKTVRVRQRIKHILSCGYMSSELEFYLCLTRILMPLFQWWYTDLEMYETKDHLHTAWRLERTKIRTELTADGAIVPKWKHELALFQLIRELYPDTLYQYRPDWLGRQSLDIYIPSLQTAIEYQGVQHYRPVDFFGGEEALLERKQLDLQKRKLCEKNNIRLLLWPYDLAPTRENVLRLLQSGPDPA